MTTTRRQRWRRRDAQMVRNRASISFPRFFISVHFEKFFEANHFRSKKKLSVFSPKNSWVLFKVMFFSAQKVFFALVSNRWINLLSSDRDPVCFFDLKLSGNFWHLLVGSNSYDFKRKKKYNDGKEGARQRCLLPDTSWNTSLLVLRFEPTNVRPTDLSPFPPV